MDTKKIVSKIENQRKFLAKEPVISVQKRKEALKNLYKNIKEMTPQICEALKSDLNKCETESYMTEIGLVLSEISYMLRHMRKLTKKKRVYSPLSNFPAKSYRVASAYGVVLIISPWNYPFLLSMEPLVDAIAAGNTVILKPSSVSANTSKVMETLIAKTFEPEHATTVLGSVDECTVLLDQDLDYIFYTGSMRVGKIVMEKAKEHFTPVTLEMGGKSPCIVDETANIPLAAKRIVFGKLLNAGQTCVAPDYVYCHESVRDRLVKEIECEIIRQYSVDPLTNKNYPKMKNEKQFNAVRELIEESKILFGGRADENTLKIEPTILNSTFEDRAMQREIFGPILPILTFKKIDEVVKRVNSMSKPLALYIFSKSKENQNLVLSQCQFGGGCVNDTIMHIANNHLAFGGVKQSGLGAYHGKFGFETFSHYKSIVKKSNLIDMPFRYQPFNKVKTWFIKFFLK